MRAQAAAGDTRGRIQQVALELFAEHGYEQTSLREIAERLGVTKAALYYHFRTKEDIVVSTLEDYFTEIDAVIAWAQGQPRTTETRREILRRYAVIAFERRTQMRFFQQNPRMDRTGISGQFQERFRTIFALMSEPDDPLRTRIRGALALIGLSVSTLFLDEPDPPEDTVLNAAALDVALEMIER